MTGKSRRYRAIVIGVSAGGIEALSVLLPSLPVSFSLPVIVVQHAAKNTESFLAEHLNRISSIQVKEAEDKEPISPGTVYLSSPGYHLLIEPDETFSLSVDARVQFSCPSIDVLFESAADVFEDSLIGIILTGGNSDGAHGLRVIKANGGIGIVQNPENSAIGVMPKAAIDKGCPDYILNIEEIAPLLVRLSNLNKEESYGPRS